MDRLNVAGISLLLVPTSEGPELSSRQHPDVEPLALVVNAAVTGAFSKLVESLEQGVDVGNQALYAVRPDPGDDFTEEANRWRELSGYDPGEDSYLVGTTFTPTAILVPRQALLEIISALQALRQQGAVISSTPPDDNGQPAMQRQPTSDLEKNTHIEEDWLQELEARAATLATVEQDEQTLEAAATASAKRRFLLLELNEAGLLSELPSQDLRQQLEQLQSPNLLAYYTAAMELNAYLRSQERKKYFFDAKQEPIVGAPVSLDWFRLQVATPEAYSRYDWLAFCESVFRMNHYTGGGGEIYTHLGNQWYRLRWRTDDGVTPALLSAAPL